jgi:hypothetical protein
VRLDNRDNPEDSDPIEDFDDDLNQEFVASSPSAAASQRKRKRSGVERADVIPQRQRDHDRDRGQNARVSRRFLTTYVILTFII